MENPCRSRRFLPPARCTTTCCRRRCGSFSAARRSRPSRSRRCRPMAGWRSSRPTIRRSSRFAGSDRGTCCTCRRKRPFTAHEVRLARAIGAVLAARYRAIFDPKQMLERGDLFRGAIEDRYVGAFLDAPASGDAGALARGPDRHGDRSAARRGALELREPGDLVRRAPARGRRRSGRGRGAWRRTRRIDTRRR